MVKRCCTPEQAWEFANAILWLALHGQPEGRELSDAVDHYLEAVRLTMARA